MGRLYFAYGSNMNPAQMLSRCPHSKAVAKATVKGYKLAINSRGVATIVKSENSRVSGVVWKISASDEREIRKKLQDKNQTLLYYEEIARKVALKPLKKTKVPLDASLNLAQYNNNDSYIRFIFSQKTETLWGANGYEHS